MKRLMILALALSLAGCATWARVEKAQTAAPDNTYTVELPVGWVRLVLVQDRIQITRDGPLLNVIAITRLAGDKAFQKTKKTAQDNMLPSELAELQIAEMKSAGEPLANMSVLENEPAMISGKPGYRLRVQFRNRQGLDFEQLVYGLADGKNYYVMLYQAPSLHYFQKSRPDFDRVVASFKLAPIAAAK